MNTRNSLFLSLMALYLASPLVLAGEPVPMKPGHPPVGMDMGESGRHGMMPRPRGRDAMPMQHRGYAQVILGHATELKLTDDQIGKITRIHQESQNQTQALGKALRDSMRETHEIFLNPSADEAGIKEKAQAQTSAFNAFLEAGLKSREAVNGTLTPTQREQLKSLKPATH